MAPSSRLAMVLLARSLLPSCGFNMGVMPLESVRGAVADGVALRGGRPGAEPLATSPGAACSWQLGGAAAAAAAAACLAASRRGQRPRPQAQRRAFENELGAQPPLGFWDPLGLSKDGSVAAFRRRRTSEIKHGRVCMLACLGYIVPEYVRLPGEISPSLGVKFSEIPGGLGALSKVPLAGWAQIIIFIGALERRVLLQQPNRAPGDFEGFGFLGLPNGPAIANPEEKKKKLASEIANGRLAMIATMAFLFQNGVTGSSGSELYGFGEDSFLVWSRVLLPGLVALMIGGDTFRRGPDPKFMKYYPRTDYYGKDRRQ